MIQQPLVSFILTCYNLPLDMLCACIDSILRLSLRSEEREIIVVDDGSDVSPINNLLRYGDEIIYVRQKNGGVSTARNTGMGMAKESISSSSTVTTRCSRYLTTTASTSSATIRMPTS